MEKQCIDCGKLFELSDNELKWYRENDLHIPKRCNLCRSKNKRIDTAGVMQREIISTNAAKRGSLSPTGAYKLNGKEPGGASGRVRTANRKKPSVAPSCLENIKPGQKLWFKRKSDHKLSYAVFKSRANGRIYAQFSDGVWSFGEDALGKSVFFNSKDAQKG